MSPTPQVNVTVVAMQLLAAGLTEEELPDALDAVNIASTYRFRTSVWWAPRPVKIIARSFMPEWIADPGSPEERKLSHIYLVRGLGGQSSAADQLLFSGTWRAVAENFVATREPD